ncbi:hypothetical protein TYRP_015635 [Tyrophagus putrescentiae]|nr:hypothetical protein TYRP_015635 [Tyrophagus putrescentiae]
MIKNAQIAGDNLVLQYGAAGNINAVAVVGNDDDGAYEYNQSLTLERNAIPKGDVPAHRQMVQLHQIGNAGKTGEKVAHLAKVRVAQLHQRHRGKGAQRSTVELDHHQLVEHLANRLGARLPQAAVLEHRPRRQRLNLLPLHRLGAAADELLVELLEAGHLRLEGLPLRRSRRRHAQLLQLQRQLKDGVLLRQLLELRGGADLPLVAAAGGGGGVRGRHQLRGRRQRGAAIGGAVL